MDLSGAWMDRAHERRPPDGIVLDLDSSESPTYGQQEGAAYNGHYRRMGLFVRSIGLARATTKIGLALITTRCSCSTSSATWSAVPCGPATCTAQKAGGTTLREKLIKIGARIVRHGCYVVFQLAEVAVPRALFAAMLRRIDRLRGPPLAAA